MKERSPSASFPFKDQVVKHTGSQLLTRFENEKNSSSRNCQNYLPCCNLHLCQPCPLVFLLLEEVFSPPEQIAEREFVLLFNHLTTLSCLKTIASRPLSFSRALFKHGFSCRRSLSPGVTAISFSRPSYTIQQMEKFTSIFFLWSSTNLSSASCSCETASWNVYNSCDCSPEP